MRYFRLYVAILFFLSACVLPAGNPLKAAPLPASQQPDAAADPLLQERLDLFLRMESLYGIPWTYLAAIDQYERSMKKRRKDEPQTTRLTSIAIPPAVWCGFLNPEEDDTDEASIAFFGGIGVDGNGDGKADQQDDVDVLTAIIRFLSEFGYAPEDFRIGLWTYYKRDRAVKTISQFANVYNKYQTLSLGRHHFPIPKRYRYSYNSTWGDARGWGGKRIHEGTDIFADYGTPVLSTGYGVIEVIGWNRYGGWRIGMRDMDNIYHYFAHLSSFRKGLKPGDIVEPGQVLGYVGSSGYGKPGTSGKFPPHLHYGMYRDTGSAEWAFDPYPYLKRWERQMYSKKRNW
jgi:murein DD-endopeptidase MepM/ murein hydrolase activator NlpD